MTYARDTFIIYFVPYDMQSSAVKASSWWCHHEESVKTVKTLIVVIRSSEGHKSQCLFYFFRLDAPYLSSQFLVRPGAFLVPTVRQYVLWQNINTYG